MKVEARYIRKTGSKLCTEEKIVENIVGRLLEIEAKNLYS